MFGWAVSSLALDTPFSDGAAQPDRRPGDAGSIRAGDLLGEYRGMEAADSAALSEILQKTGNLLLLHPEIKEIDLNPIILKGSHPVVVDALITF